MGGDASEGIDVFSDIEALIMRTAQAADDPRQMYAHLRALAWELERGERRLGSIISRSGKGANPVMARKRQLG